MLLDCGANVCVFPRDECVKVWNQVAKLFLGDDKSIETTMFGEHPEWGDGVAMEGREGSLIAFCRAAEKFRIQYNAVKNAFILLDRKEGCPVYVAKCTNGLYPLEVCETVSNLFHVGTMGLDKSKKSKLLLLDLHKRLDHAPVQRILKAAKYYEGYECLENFIPKDWQCVPCVEAQDGTSKNSFPSRCAIEKEPWVISPQEVCLKE